MSDIEGLLGEKIGEGLIRLGEITSADVELVLGKQKSGDTRLFGDIAVDLGIVDMMAVIRYIEQS